MLLFNCSRPLAIGIYLFMDVAELVLKEVL
jgi:hypothetical protein